MVRWQDRLLNKLVLDSHFCYVINDPDNLCFEPYIAQHFEHTGTVIVSEDDPIVLRLIYEQWLEEQETIPLVIRLSQDSGLIIPHDIEVHAKTLDFHINEVIPELDSTVLRYIDPSCYQLLISAVSNYKVGKLSKVDSLDFVLRHVYKIAPEIIQTEVDLVRLLIRKHYINPDMPTLVEQRLIQLLSFNPVFSAWKFEQIIPNKNEFFAFLQSQWDMYLESQVAINQVKENAWPVASLIVPFNDQDIKVYIDNLFADGLLQPVHFEGLEKDHWAWIGIQTEGSETELIRYTRLLESLTQKFAEIEDSKFTIDFWGDVAHNLGRLNAYTFQLGDVITKSDKSRHKALNIKIDQLFERWLVNNYGSLITQPSIRYPNMLHKIPDWLDNTALNQDKKVCLLVMDGMGFQQWSVIRDKLLTCSNLVIDEHYCFAWVPTITSISRQALFSGKRPQLFAGSLLSTSKEEALWRAYWEDKGLQRNQVLFKKKIENIKVREEFVDLFYPPSLKVAGLVVNFIDEQMHGMVAGMAGLNAVVQVWLDDWQFTDKIASILDAGFEIVITADHGNQEGVGCGWPNEGVKAETKGERVRMYKSSESASSSAEISDDEVVEWPAKKFGLPADFYPLVSKGTHAFVQKGKKIVGHGGISLHEVVVPLVTIKRSY